MERTPIFQVRATDSSPEKALPAFAAIRPTAAPAAPTSGAAPQRKDIISGVVDASVDVRKACNAIKRMASLGSASMVSGLDPKEAVEASQRMAYTVLQSIGFNVADEARVESVMPMMIEATSAVLADAARRAPGGKFGLKELTEASALGVAALSEIARSRVVAKMIEADWPADIDGVTALRLAAASAMALVAVEVAEFDFMHTSTECIKEAGKVVVKVATEASAAIAPAKSSAAARLTLTQSLINSAAKLYAASWRAVAAEQAGHLDSLPEAALNAELDAMGAAPIAMLLAPVNKKFLAAYAAVTTGAIEMFEHVEVPAAPTVAKPWVQRPRTGR